MSKQLSELCVALIQEIYGDLPSRLFSVLIQHHRLTLAQLVVHTRFPRSLVRNGLAVLIQFNLALFSPASPISQTTYYSANAKRAYSLVRYGKYSSLVRRRYGKDASVTFDALLAAGHTTTATLEQQAAKDLDEAASTLSNGDALPNGAGDLHVNASSLDRSQAAIKELTDVGLISRFREIDAMPELDAEGIIERMVIHDMPQFKGPTAGPKKEKELLAHLRAYRRRIRDEEDELKEPPLVVAQAQLTEEMTDHDSGQKRKKRKLNNGVGYGGVGQDEYEVDPSHLKSAAPKPPNPDEALHHINTERLEVFLQSEYLVELCDRSMGELPARVYGTILGLLEKELPRCFDDFEETNVDGYNYLENLPFITSREVANALDGNLDLQQEAGSKHTNGISHSQLGSVDGERVQEVDSYLRMLAEHPSQFITRTQINGATRWCVNFAALSHHLIQTEIENLVGARFGPLGARIIRILRAKGKLDEKQVGQIGLVRQRELRATLTAMQAAGFIDTQEVPRDATRQPSRTIYLWFYDAQRARSLVLDDTYKAMARLLQRARVEKGRLRAVIDKAERSDVRGREAQFLSHSEFAALEAWHEREERFLVQLARQDDLVAVLRDFLPAKGNS